MDVIDTIEYKGFKIKVFSDDSPDSPRNWDNLGKMICFHRRYSLGDKHDLSIEEAKKLEQSKNTISLPLYLYDHSGITMNTTGFNCPWDSGKVGFIYVEKKDVRKEWGWKQLSAKRIKKIEDILRSEVDVYDDYLRGNVYGYKIESPEGDELEDGSVWGFYGYDHEKSGLLESAHPTIDYEIKRRTAIKDAEEVPFEKLPLLINESEFEGVKEVVKRRLKEEPHTCGVQTTLSI